MPTVTTQRRNRRSSTRTGAPVSRSCFTTAGPSSSDDWDAQLLFFVPRGFRVIAHDRRGHGRSSQPRTGTTWTTTPPTRRPWSSSSTSATPSTSGTRPAAARSRATSPATATDRVAKAVLIGAVPPLMLQTDANPGGLPIEVFDGFREGTGSNRSQFFLDVASGPFYGFNRPGRRSRKGSSGTGGARA